MPVVDVFKGGALFELGVMQEPFEPQIFPIGFFILDQQAQELLVAQIGGFGMSESFAKTVGHTEEL
jgi:hypothetical protein